MITILESYLPTTKTAIEQALFPINEAKIRSSEDTPFMQHPLTTDFGYHGNPTTINAVLDGTYEPPNNTDQYTCMFLCAAALPD